MAESNQDRTDGESDAAGVCHQDEPELGRSNQLFLPRIEGFLRLRTRREPVQLGVAP